MWRSTYENKGTQVIVANGAGCLDTASSLRAVPWRQISSPKALVAPASGGRGEAILPRCCRCLAAAAAAHRRSAAHHPLLGLTPACPSLRAGCGPHSGLRQRL